MYQKPEVKEVKNVEAREFSQCDTLRGQAAAGR